MKILWFLLISTLFSLFGGWIFYLYWGWFFVPAFGHPITYKQAVGISMLIGLELSGIVVAINSKDDDAIETYALYGFMLGYSLISGFLWHFFLT